MRDFYGTFFTQSYLAIEISAVHLDQYSYDCNLVQNSWIFFRSYKITEKTSSRLFYSSLACHAALLTNHMRTALHSVLSCTSSLCLILSVSGEKKHIKCNYVSMKIRNQAFLCQNSTGSYKEGTFPAGLTLQTISTFSQFYKGSYLKIQVS